MFAMNNELCIETTKTYHLRNIYICGPVRDSPVKRHYIHYKSLFCFLL